ncbi:uncharacterized protein LOC116192554 [Punica granatum]|uniref:Uncharacterized protein n=2 Tax=Punica granatum TaxID=22663 RepID=A0A218WEL6_PUNGR|nr:uncharacterized protein LOC116192554 [Punica granatum]OWM71277.1 hypothetical protein CDL15_Pgr011404 [Punica granatum]PKI38880.1 hypothetical protein CRG98_040730 [Punica granatum]
MGCGKSKHDVATGNTVSQSKRLSSESKKNNEAAAVPKVTKDTAQETEVKGDKDKGVTKEATEEKAIVEEKEDEGNSGHKDSSRPEVPANDGKAKVEPKIVVEEKGLVKETGAEEEKAKGATEVLKEENPIKEEVQAAAPSVEEAKAPSVEVAEAPDATVKDENQTTEKVAEAGSTASNPKTE